MHSGPLTLPVCTTGPILPFVVLALWYDNVTFIQQHALSSSEENERRTTKNNGKRSAELITDTLEYALGC